MIRLLVIPFLLFFLYQDLRFRAIYWICYPVLMILLILLALPGKTAEMMMYDAGVNLGFLMIQLFLLTVYFSLKHKKMVNITQRHLGWGDVLFLVVIAAYMSPLNYIVFYLGSLLMVLVLAAAFGRLRQGGSIPLAGLQAFLFAVILAADSSNRILSDHWITGFIKA